jgi:hypothetical protein
MESPENHIKFDFLGKDSIRYENEVEVEEKVWRLVQKFCNKNADGKGASPFLSDVLCHNCSLSLPHLYMVPGREASYGTSRYPRPGRVYEGALQRQCHDSPAEPYPA